MEPLIEASAVCPYCGEPVDFSIDTSAGEQTFVEDCSVCCQPIVVTIKWTNEGPTLELHRENE
ncbi:CPXCG motif-containing cysteine-rich protein [Guyparkeria hydrothermalis]|uniref:CPXCG motif-containing cysteine-rich protein n=1 Tax=Guyparkeria hydrothermalis TaxID=923 RepID=UPI002020ACA2|nr:CPXCG motif-containing cysteine-rich protein [Guyparkeria hydrothermalis]MCL7745461.1 CPXCG motif-containing cysteine-rich protein [Guyparkeria hydrothermalis]